MNMTTNPVEPGNCTGSVPEFGRCADVQRLYGIKRGTLYNLHHMGKIKSVSLRVRGEKQGVRLFHLASVRDYILSQMEAATPGK